MQTKLNTVTLNIIYVFSNSRAVWFLMSDLDLWQKHSVKYHNTVSAQDCFKKTVVTIPFGFTNAPKKSIHTVRDRNIIFSFTQFNTMMTKIIQNYNNTYGWKYKIAYHNGSTSSEVTRNFIKILVSPEHYK